MNELMERITDKKRKGVKNKKEALVNGGMKIIKKSFKKLKNKFLFSKKV